MYHPRTESRLLNPHSTEVDFVFGRPLAKTRVDSVLADIDTAGVNYDLAGESPHDFFKSLCKIYDYQT